MRLRHAVLSAYFILGAYAVCAQATLLRETQVLLFGSELSWGLVLACWLAGVAIGSHTGGRLVGKARRPWFVLAVSNLVMPLIMTADVVLLRGARHLLGSGPGEYIGLPGMLMVAAMASVPVSFWVGLAFPAASALLGEGNGNNIEKARSVGWVYLFESAGSLVGGALFSFVLVANVDAVSLMLGGGAILAAVTALLGYREAVSRSAPLAIIALAVLMAAGIFSGLSGKLNATSLLQRWRSFAPGQELVSSVDSKYQNIAVGRLANQFSTYTNGTIAATWPDHTTLAIEAHLAACQHPCPDRILVLGGGAEGLIKELIRHRPERLDYVTLDRRLLESIRPLLPVPDRDALESGLPDIHFTDLRRFVKETAQAGTPRYDLILLAAPEPASTLEARLYTEEFFAELERVLIEDGVLAFSITASVGHWGPEMSTYVGSVLGSLERVFPDVLITFGNPARIFAAGQRGVLVDTGKALAERFRSRRIESPYFNPLWFEGASDMLDPVKRETVRRALRQQLPRFLNTDNRPAAALYHMRMWVATGREAHTGEEAPAGGRSDLLSALLRVRFGWIVAGLIALTLLAGLAGFVRGGESLKRGAILWSVGTTGLASMSVEIVLLYTFQVLYGYIYGMVGLVIGVFMFGLVLGSWIMNRRLLSLAGRRSRKHSDGASGSDLRDVFMLDTGIMVFAILLVPVLGFLRGIGADLPVQIVIYLLVAVSGVLGGIVFPLASSVWLSGEESTARAAGAVSAADHLGGSLGALVTGIVLVPVLGIVGTCLLVAIMKGLSAVLTAFAAFQIKGPATLKSA